MKRLLFICLGNICRSPAAEGIMKSLIEQENLQDIIYVDSAGTINYHSGELPWPEMREHAILRGYDLTHRARQFKPVKDFSEFDYIVTMDDQNYRDIIKLDKDGLYYSKIFRMAQFSSRQDVQSVPDPYDCGPEAFENVLNILEDTCANLLIKIKDELK
jgi:protein-tyrosine phosphatase